jgi:hypothetical protein
MPGVQAGPAVEGASCIKDRSEHHHAEDRVTANDPMDRHFRSRHGTGGRSHHPPRHRKRASRRHEGRAPAMCRDRCRPRCQGRVRTPTYLRQSPARPAASCALHLNSPLRGSSAGWLGRLQRIPRLRHRRLQAFGRYEAGLLRPLRGWAGQEPLLRSQADQTGRGDARHQGQPPGSRTGPVAALVRQLHRGNQWAPFERPYAQRSSFSWSCGQPRSA